MSRYVLKKTGKMLLYLFCAVTIVYFVLSLAPSSPAEVILAKPVVYLYPTQIMEVAVDVELTQGHLTVTDPPIGQGWQVTAQPDGQLTDSQGNQYPYLFWEADAPADFDFSNGFVVPGSQTEEFLREKLALLGLNDRETADFLEYWQPRMEEKAYNLVAFQTERYTELAQLNIEPAPDSVIRVFMAYQPLEEPVEVEPQVLQPATRHGFAAVEWGGSEVRP